MDDKAAIALIRKQRHSFMNHLQVISGWLQLGKTEKAMQYLTGVADRATGESGVLKQAPPGVALLVVEAGLEAETYGVSVQWRVTGPVANLAEADLARARSQVMAAIAAGGGERPVQVILGPEGVRVHTPSE